MDKVEDKLVTILDALQTGAVTVGEQVVKYSPDVADAALMIVRVDAAETLLWSLAMLLITISVILKYREGYSAWLKEKLSGHSPDAAIASIIFGLQIPAAVMFFSLSDILSIWNWVALFEPKLALAKRIAEAAGL